MTRFARATSAKRATIKTRYATSRRRFITTGERSMVTITTGDMVGTVMGGMIATTITINFILATRRGRPRAAPRFFMSRRFGTAELNYIAAYAVLSFQNFERILPAPKSAYTPVKLKNGKEEWLLA